MSSGHRGRIVALSRRGLLPQAPPPGRGLADRCGSKRRSIVISRRFRRWLRGLARRSAKPRAATGAASSTGCVRIPRRSGAKCRHSCAGASSNMRAPGGTPIATAWRRRSRRKVARADRRRAGWRSIAGKIVDVAGDRQRRAGHDPPARRESHRDARRLAHHLLQRRHQRSREKRKSAGRIPVRPRSGANRPAQDRHRGRCRMARSSTNGGAPRGGSLR